MDFVFGRGVGGRGRGGRGRGRGRGGYTSSMSMEGPTDGTGYGGKPDDNKKLVAGRKKAQKAEAKDDKASIRFLKVSLVLIHVYSYDVTYHLLYMQY